MARRRFNRYSGIGGQAVLEGVMMKNKEKYSIAVRKPDGKISVEVENYNGKLEGKLITKIPFVRGIFNFIDSLVIGMKCMNYSASFYDEEDGKAGNPGKSDKFISALITFIAIVMAVGIFVVLPYYLSSLFGKTLRNQSLMNIIEGVIRIVIFIIYVVGISIMKDIRRLYQYHGAEHKCINCIERGRPLTVQNVMRSSRLHKRCGTSFIFFVFFVSIILFFFIRVDSPVERVALRVLLMPVVAGISYEIIKLAGRSDNILVRIISAPGMLIQRMTTREPDTDMAEVAIAAVEAVFDWKQFLKFNFGYRLEEDYEEDADREDEAAGGEGEYGGEAEAVGGEGEYAGGEAEAAGGEGEYAGGEAEAVGDEGEYAGGKDKAAVSGTGYDGNKAGAVAGEGEYAGGKHGNAGSETGNTGGKNEPDSSGDEENLQ